MHAHLLGGKMHLASSRSAQLVPPEQRARQLRRVTAALLTHELCEAPRAAPVALLASRLVQITHPVRTRLGEALGGGGSASGDDTGVMPPRLDAEQDVGVHDAIVDLLVLSYRPLFLQATLAELFRGGLEDKDDLRRTTARLVLARAPPSTTTQQAPPWPLLVAHRVLSIILVMDRWPSTVGMAVMDHYPLFLPTAPFKSSSALILALARLLLTPGHSPAELEPRLRKAVDGFAVSYRQPPLHDVDLHVDPDHVTALSDGVVLFTWARRRLLPLSNACVDSHSHHLVLRVPAMSRLQKIHNVSLLMTDLLPRLPNANPHVAVLPWAKFSVRDVVSNRNDAAWRLAFELLKHFSFALTSQEKRILQWRVKEETRTAMDGGGDGTQAAFMETMARLKQENPERFLHGLRDDDDDEALLLHWATVILARRGFPVRSSPHSFESGAALVELLAVLEQHPLPVTTGLHEDWIPHNTLSATARAVALRTQRNAFAVVEGFCRDRAGVPYPFDAPSGSSLVLPSREQVLVFLGQVFRHFHGGENVSSLPMEEEPVSEEHPSASQGLSPSLTPPRPQPPLQVAICVPAVGYSPHPPPPPPSSPPPPPPPPSPPKQQSQQQPSSKLLLRTLRHCPRHNTPVSTLLERLDAAHAALASESSKTSNGPPLSRHQSLVVLNTCMCVMLGFRDEAVVVARVKDLLREFVDPALADEDDVRGLRRTRDTLEEIAAMSFA